MSTAIEVVRQGALLAQKIGSEMVISSLTKSDASPVTVADFAVQALVGWHLQRLFPSDPLIAEETPQALQEQGGGATLERVCHYLEAFLNDARAENVLQWIGHGTQATADRYWTLDPVDGTKGFLRGGQYAVALALVERGQVRLGVLGCPRLRYSEEFDSPGPGVLLAAGRGEGAWTTALDSPGQWTRLQVSSRTEMHEVRILQSFEPSHTNDEQMSELLQELQVRQPPIRLDSQAKYALLAAGMGDVLLKLLSRRDYGHKIWDHAAGTLMVEEAGGRVSDLNGRPLDFSAGRTLARNVGVLACNGRYHERILETLKQLGVTTSLHNR